MNQQRRKHLGFGGNGGQYAAQHRDLPTVMSLSGHDIHPLHVGGPGMASHTIMIPYPHVRETPHEYRASNGDNVEVIAAERLTATSPWQDSWVESDGHEVSSDVIRERDSIVAATAARLQRTNTQADVRWNAATRTITVTSEYQSDRNQKHSPVYAELRHNLEDGTWTSYLGNQSGIPEITACDDLDDGLDHCFYLLTSTKGQP